MEAFGEALIVEPYLPLSRSAHSSSRAAAREAQQQRILPACRRGQAARSPSRTPRPARATTCAGRHARARHDGDGYVLDGEKAASSCTRGAPTRWSCRRGPTAATPTPTASACSSSTRRARGRRSTAYRTLDELRAADVGFDGVRGRRDALVGAPGRALPLIEEVVDFATALVCAEAVGAIKFANDATLEYLKTRKQFGVPIGTFQALQHRMVDMLIELRAGALDGQPRVLQRRYRAMRPSASRAVSAAKIKIADACRHVSQESVQLHGGMGMTEELKVSHTFRRLTIDRAAVRRRRPPPRALRRAFDRERRMTRTASCSPAARGCGERAELPDRGSSAAAAGRRRGAGQEPLAVARPVHARPHERREELREAARARRGHGRARPSAKSSSRASSASTSATRC